MQKLSWALLLPDRQLSVVYIGAYDNCSDSDCARQLSCLDFSHLLWYVADAVCVTANVPFLTLVFSILWYTITASLCVGDADNDFPMTAGYSWLLPLSVILICVACTDVPCSQPVDAVISKSAGASSACVCMCHINFFCILQLLLFGSSDYYLSSLTVCWQLKLVMGVI